MRVEINCVAIVGTLGLPLQGGTRHSLGIPSEWDANDHSQRWSDWAQSLGLQPLQHESRVGGEVVVEAGLWLWWSESLELLLLLLRQLRLLLL